MEVIILAGGVGSRLRGVVNDVPKCMANVAGKPFLHYLFEYLIPYQPEQVILSLGYKHEVVESWIKSLIFPFCITCKIENTPLGTGGAIKYALSVANEPDVVVINGDTFFDINLSHLLDFHKQRQATASLALKSLKDFDRYGTVRLDTQAGKITGFEEKKRCKSGLINGGIYVIRKNTLDDFPTIFSMENDFFSEKVDEGQFYGMINDGYFIDIGIPSDYEKAQQDFNNGKISNFIS